MHVAAKTTFINKEKKNPAQEIIKCNMTIDDGVLMAEHTTMKILFD